MDARELNHHLARGRKRADELEQPLADIVKPILDRAGDEAARNFERHATDFLTASGYQAADDERLVQMTPDTARGLLTSLALRAAAPDLMPTSTMVALYPRPEEAAAIAEAGGEEAGILHVTLAYLGDTDEDTLRAALEAIGPVAASYAPLTGHVGGVGSFGDKGDSSPAILLPDVPGLVELRVAVTEALARAGIDYGREHGFQPHITIRYTENGVDVPDAAAIGQPLHFDCLCLARGNVMAGELPLVGVPAVTAAGGPSRWSAPNPDQLVDVDGLVAGLRGKTDPVRQAVAETMMTPALEGAGLAFDVTNPYTAKVLQQSASQVTHIAETTQENVMRIIHRSYEEGLSIPDTAAAIREGMRDANVARSTLIARTELAGVVNGGSLAATEIVSSETGDEYLKQWLTAPGAPNPRHEDYDGLDGQTVPLDGYFDVGGWELEYPGDPSGPPEEVCDCRCTMVYVGAGEGEAAGDGGVGGVGGGGGEEGGGGGDLGGFDGGEILPSDMDMADSGDGGGPTIFTGGKVDEIERFEASDKIALDAGEESMVTDEANNLYSEMYAKLEGEVDAATWPAGPAQSEAYDAVTRVGVDQVMVLRNESGEMLGVVDFNPGLPLADLEEGLADIRADLASGYLEKDSADRMIAEYERAIKHQKDKVAVGVNHLASTGQVPGTGARLMQEVAKVATTQGKGVGLNSLDESSSGFYKRLGMHADDPARPNDYYWTADEAKRFAETGSAEEPASGSIGGVDMGAAEFGPVVEGELDIPAGALSDDPYIRYLQEELNQNQNLQRGVYGKIKRGTATREADLEPLRERAAQLRALIENPDPAGELKGLTAEDRKIIGKIKRGTATEDDVARQMWLRQRQKDLRKLVKGREVVRVEKVVTKTPALKAAKSKWIVEGEKLPAKVNYSYPHHLRLLVEDLPDKQWVEVPAHDVHLGGSTYKATGCVVWRQDGVIIQQEIRRELDRVYYIEEVQGKVEELLGQISPEMRAELQQINVMAGESPSNAFFREKYGAGFHGAAAQAGGGQVTFWKGTLNLRQSTFDHEMGHIVGPWGGPPSDVEWAGLQKLDQAYARDKFDLSGSANVYGHSDSHQVTVGGMAVSTYGKVALCEDWAESIRLYLAEKRGQEIGVLYSHHHLKFSDLYPNRYKLIEKFMDALQRGEEYDFYGED